MPAHRRPFLDWPWPLAFAHRGGAVDCPENTMPAFESSVAMGYRYLETDAHVTADGVVVAFHDDRLDRVTDSRGLISEQPWTSVAAAEAGFDFSLDGGITHPFRGRGLRVPRLDQLLEAFPNVRVNIDAKSDAVVEPLARLLTATGSLDRVCVGSFSDRRIGRIRRLCGPRLCTSMGPRAVAAARIGAWLGVMARLGADCLQVPLRGGGVRLVDRSLLRAAHRAGLQVHVWTVDDADEIVRLLDLGVDGIMTDRPVLLRRILIERGQWGTD